ncbi:hypothetical protein M404DRAFT_1001816, partial [Pisolithus tinctorius Marx 270]
MDLAVSSTDLPTLLCKVSGTLYTFSFSFLFVLCFTVLPPRLEFPAERQVASHLAPSCALHDASHPQIQFQQGTLSTWPPSTPLVARQDKCYLPHTKRVSRSFLRRASRFLADSYYSTSALCRYQVRLHAPSRSGDIRVFVD